MRGLNRDLNQRFPLKGNLTSFRKEKIVWQILAVTLAVPLLSGCGVVGISNSCFDIRKESIDKREVGMYFIGAADAGEVGEGLTVEELRNSGYKYLLEGLNLIVKNPQCFSEEEVRVAERLLNT